jgi:hypothetical protein
MIKIKGTADLHRDADRSSHEQHQLRFQGAD